MAKTTPRKGRPANSAVAPGIFLRGNTFWLRYSAGGEQVRISLETEDPTEAIKRAGELRGRPIVSKTGQIRGGKSQIERDSEKYQAAKLASGNFTDGTAKAAKQAISNFEKTMEISDGAKITREVLAAYYAKLKTEKSEATAQTYVTKLGSFARWLGYRVETPKLPDAPTRDLVIPPERVWELIELAEPNELKFVLMAGFFAGMRRGEIAWARPAWFDFERGKINIPNPDLVTGWKPKSRRKRSTPLTKYFAEWILETFPNWKNDAFCIRPEVAAGKAIYRFDTRKMFEAFAKKHCPNLTPHVMRHTYVTRLANNPNISIAQLSEFSGDRIATLERHYIHLDSNAQNAAESFGERVEPPIEIVDEGAPKPRGRVLDGYEE